MVKCFHLGMGWGLAAALCAAAPPAAPARKVTTVVRPDARTGRLVRAVAVSPRVAAPAVVAPAQPDKRPKPAALREAAEQVAWQNALPVELIHSVIKVESNYNPQAISPKGAMGLMQLVPATARRFGVSDAFDPMENLRGGARYLRYLLDLYGENNYHLALAAYNAGEGAVARYGGVPPYAETQNYLALVGRARDDARRRGAPAADSQPAGSSHQTVGGKPVEVQNHIREVVEPDGRIRYVSQ